MAEEDRTNEAAQPVVTGAPTARVADSYGPNPHEHKPSQDAFDPDADKELAEEKQATTAEAADPAETAETDAEEESSPGTSSSSSESSNASTQPKSKVSRQRPARSAGNR